MKIAFPPLLAIVGVFAQFQLIAIGRELEPSAPSSASLGPEGAQTTAQGALIDGQRRNAPVSAERVALDEVRAAVQANPNKAPDIVKQAIRTDVPHPVPLSCKVVRAAITALGKKTTSVLVARIVYAAVSEQPIEALCIVGVAIQDTAAAFHQDIVHAAIAAVPDPYVRVSRTRLESETCDQSAACNGAGAAQSDSKNGIPLSDAIYEEALLTGATAYDLEYFPVLGVTGIANDDLINKNPPPPTPHPVSP